MKMYYEMLEVSENASREVIEKAYRVLVKKNHPDLQTSENKVKAEERIKKINEAYEILSDESKKKQYDIELKQYKENELNKKIEQHRNRNETSIHQIKKEASVVHDQNSVQEQNMNNQQNNASNNIDLNQVYKDIYDKIYKQVNYHKGLYRKQYYKNRLKDLLAIFLTSIALVSIGGLLWIIPETKNYLVNIYNENSVIKAFVDIIIGFFS